LNDQSIKKFSDPYFKPELKSLIPEDLNDPSFEKTPKKYIQEYKTYQWLSLSEIYRDKKYTLFDGEITADEINQGFLGSCYILVSLMGLCINNQRIKRIFLNKEVNSKGVYGVKLLIQGEYNAITVDDFIPCKRGDMTPAFSYTKNNEIWIMILEKAWAKINKSCYMRTWLGTPHEALTTLTEAPCVFEHHKKYIDNHRIDELWRIISCAMERKWVPCADTEEIKNSEEVGLVPFHAYAIIKIYDLPEYDLKLMKIRNPWGAKVWKGDYSSTSNLWTENLKKAIGQNEFNISKGTFFISFEDYVKNFAWTFICKYEDNYHYRYKRFTMNTEDHYESSNELNRGIDNYQFVKSIIEVKQHTHGFICLHQPQKRFMDTKDNTQEKIPIGLIILTKYQDKKYRLISTDFINWEKIYLEVTFDPGEYHIFAKSLVIQKDISYPLVLSSYSEYPLEIHKPSENKIAKNCLSNILIDLAKNNSKKQYFSEKEKSSYYSVLIDECNSLGHGIFYYENNSKNGYLNVTVSFQESQGIKVLWNQTRSENILEFKINPIESKAFFLEFVKMPWECKIKWSHELNYNY
jgi:hypothetical protein